MIFCHSISAALQRSTAVSRMTLAQPRKSRSMLTLSRRIVMWCGIVVIGATIGVLMLMRDLERQVSRFGAADRHVHAAAMELEIKIYEYVNTIKDARLDITRAAAIIADSKADMARALQALAGDLLAHEAQSITQLSAELMRNGDAFVAASHHVTTVMAHLHSDLGSASSSLMLLDADTAEDPTLTLHVDGLRTLLDTATTLTLLGRTGIASTGSAMAEVADLNAQAQRLAAAGALPQAALLSDLALDVQVIVYELTKFAAYAQQLDGLAVRIDTLLDDQIQQGLNREYATLGTQISVATSALMAAAGAAIIALLASLIKMWATGKRTARDMQAIADAIGALGSQHIPAVAQLESAEAQILHAAVLHQAQALSLARHDRTRFSELLDEIGEHRVIVDRQGRILEATLQAGALLATSADDSLVGSDLNVVLGPAFDINALWSLTLSRVLPLFNWRGVLSNSATVSLWISGLRLLDKDGQAERLMLILHRTGDGAKRAEQIGDWATGGILLLNAEYAVLASNLRAGALLGHTGASLVGVALRGKYPEISTHNPCEAPVTQADGTETAVSITLHAITQPGEAMVYLAKVEDITTRKTALKVIERLAYVDELTDLPNRTNFQQHLQRSLDRADRNGEKIALLYLDLDNFKDVNDSLGHHYGDELLRTIGRRLQRVVRKADVAARLGGDEFAVVLHAVSDDANEVTRLAQRIHAEIGEYVEINGCGMRPSVSIGIASYPHDAKDPTGLLRAADSAMYAAKRQRDLAPRVAYYEPSLTRAAEQRLMLDQALRSALDGAQFVLYYQPLIEIADCRMCGVEALIRWRHPTRGVLDPGAFIEVAESIGIMDALGIWVLEEACRQAVAWQLMGLDLTMSVNVSPVQLKNADFVAALRRIVADTGIEPNRLQIEITESVIQDSDEVRRALGEIRHTGVRLALDDFGTGYSSLGSLRSMPIDCLKIDRAFLTGLIEEINGSLFLGTIVGLARSLGMSTVAEGIETPDQFALAQGLGVDYAQGYLFSRPMPGAEIPLFTTASLAALVARGA